MSKNNIYMYWTGPTYSLLNVLKCLAELHSTSGAGYTIHIINHENIKSYVTELPECFYDLCPAHQADYVRVYVLYERGGIWMDADTIVMESMDAMFDMIKQKDGFFILQNNDTLWNGVFGTKPNTPLMRMWKDRIQTILDSEGSKIKWETIGRDCLEYIKETNPTFLDNYTVLNGLDTVYPVNWNTLAREFLGKPYDNYITILRDFQPFIVLINSVYKHLDKQTEQEILKMNHIPINYFLQTSIENKGIQVNTLYNNVSLYNYGPKDYISNSIIKYQAWEPNMTNVFNNILSHKMDNIVLDVGCNIGYYSISSSGKCKHIYSFDGNKTNVDMLSLSMTYNGIQNITPVFNIVADKETNYKMKNKAQVDQCGNIGGLSFEQSEDNTSAITSITLDDFIASQKLDVIDLIKVDVEGGELSVLKGCRHALQSDIIKHIVIEITPKFNSDSVEILSILQSNNYDMYNIPHKETGLYTYSESWFSSITQSDKKILDVPAFVKTIPVQTNVLAIKRKSFGKIAIVADWIIPYITQEHYIFVKNLEKYGWTILPLSSLNIDLLKSQSLQTVEKTLVLCVTYDDFDISKLKCDTITLMYKIDDLHPFKDIRKKCIESCDMLVSPYQYLFPKMVSMYGHAITEKPSVWVPYSAVNEFLEGITLNKSPKDDKIFLSGAVRNVYPLRSMLCTDVRFKDIVERLNHPSYDIDKRTHDVVNKKYYQRLNEYLCCFCDASCYEYILLKMFEITAVGSLLLVEDSIKEQLKALGFIDMETCILCNTSNVYDKMKWILDKTNRPIVDMIRARGMELSQSRHMTADRSKRFNSVVNTMIKQDLPSREIYDIL